MAVHVDNQISLAIRKFLKTEFENLAEEYIIEIDDLFSSKVYDFDRKLKAIENILEAIGKLKFESTQRQTIVSELTEFKNQLGRINSEQKRFVNINKNLIKEIGDEINSFEESNDGHEPDFEEIFEIIEAIENFDVRIGGQTISVSIKNTKNLKEKTLLIFEGISADTYRATNTLKIKSLKEKISKKSLENEKTIKAINEKINFQIFPMINKIVDVVSTMNMSTSLFFKEFVSVVQATTGLVIEIESYAPGEDYDIKYAIFLDACDRNDINKLFELALEIFSDVDFSNFTKDEFCQYLQTNYFG